MNWATVDVTAENPYQVVIGAGAARLLPDCLTGATRVAIIHPAALAERAGVLAAGLEQQATLIEVPDAEAAKTGAVLQACWDRLADAGFTRSDAVVGLGGGATTDLAGFVAASWLRGVRYLALPTSLLAMVDGAVGGKTGINLEAGKNLVGAFYEPYMVLCDTDLLTSLPARELRSGLAEAVKAGFIADPSILDLIEQDPFAVLNPTTPVLATVLERAVRVKASVVSADLRERTSEGSDIGREVLNYGHTLAHAIERLEHFSWRHGEAVSVGLVFAAELSLLAGRLDAALVERHRAVLSSLGLPVAYRDGAWPELRRAMGIDKKTRGASLRFVVLDGLAEPAILGDPDEDALETAYARICSRAGEG